MPIRLARGDALQALLQFGNYLVFPSSKSAFGDFLPGRFHQFQVEPQVV
jgi:hypothetical protein